MRAQEQAVSIDEMAEGMTRQKARFAVLAGIKDKCMELLEQINVNGDSTRLSGLECIAKVSTHLCQVHSFASC